MIIENALLKYRKWKLKRRIKKAIGIFEGLNTDMKMAGITRLERRRFFKEYDVETMKKMLAIIHKSIT